MTFTNVIVSYIAIFYLCAYRCESFVCYDELRPEANQINSGLWLGQTEKGATLRN